MSYFKHDNALVGNKAKIGDNTRVWAFTNVQDGAVIGADCNICDGCFVEKGAVIGNEVTIKNHVCVFDGITLEDKVFVGANVAFINDRHPRSDKNFEWKLEKITVSHGATLGANVTVICGITIGQFAFVGAGSVVTKDVEPYALVYGNPARFKGYVCECGQKLSSELKCECKRSYSKTKEGLKLNE